MDVLCRSPSTLVSALAVWGTIHGLPLPSTPFALTSPYPQAKADEKAAKEKVWRRSLDP